MKLSLISKHRTPLMGISALLIIICHAPQYGVIMPLLLKKIVVMGNMGVDMFLFLSGFGCYYSLNNHNGNISDWFIKKIKRIWVRYTIVKIPIWLILILVGHFNFIYELYRYSTLSFWTLHDADWYIALLVPLYLLTPFLFYIFEHTSNRIYVCIFIILLIILLTHISIGNKSEVLYRIIHNVQWAFERTSSFIIGLAIAPFIKSNIDVSINKCILGSFALFCVYHSLLPSYNFFWIFVVPVCMFCSLIYENLSKRYNKVLCLYWLGTISLESYIANVGLKECFTYIFPHNNFSFILYGHYLDYLFIIIFGLLIAYVSNICYKNFFNVT